MTDREIENFIRTSPKGHFCQSEKWASVKRDWTHKTVAVTDDAGNIKGAISFLLRKTPVLPFQLMYAPRGPVCDPNDAETLKALIEKSKELAKKCYGYIIKIDPDVPVQNTVFIKTLEDAGFSRIAGKNFDAVQPNFVFRLDIKGKAEDEVFTGFAAKTRYNIRVAEKSGVKVRVGGLPDLDEFVRIMKITGERDGFATRPKYYFEGLLTAMGENARLYIAELNGKIIAATLPIQYGNKTWYLYGASDNAYRNVMPNYLLQWEMIRWAIQSGCEVYDFRGVSGDLSPDNPLYGLYRFKKGFNGELTEFCGEFNLVTNPVIERLVNRGIEMMKKTRR